MKLGEFIKQFSHNNLIRLHYAEKGGHICVLDNWDDVSMDHEILKGKGKNRHYINNEVIKIVGILVSHSSYPDAINIEIERLNPQPMIEEIIEEQCCSESINDVENVASNIKLDVIENVLTHDYYWVGDEWIQPPVRIQHGDLVDITAENYLGTMLGRYIGKGYGVVELYNYATGIKYVIGKVHSRGIDRNPRLVPYEKLLELIFD